MRRGSIESGREGVWITRQQEIAKKQSRREEGREEEMRKEEGWGLPAEKMVDEVVAEESRGRCKGQNSNGEE